MKEKRKNNSLNITRHTQKSWLKTFPSSDIDEWEERACAYNVYDFISQTLSMLENINIEPYDSVKVVTLDDNYYKYLEKENLENTAEQRSIYAAKDTYTDTQLLNMAKKANLDKAYTLLTIPIVMIRKDNVSSTDYKLNESQINGLTQYLEQIHGKENIFVYGNVVKLEDLLTCSDKFYANGNLYFEKGIRFEMSEFRRQKYGTKVNLAFLGIPFLVKSPVKKMHFSLSELEDIFNALEYTPEVIESLTQEEFNEYNVKAPDFFGSDIYNELIKEDTIEIMPIQIPLNEIDDLIEELVEGFM